MATNNTIDITSFITNFADSIDGVDPSTIEPSTKLSDIAQWDSLAVLVTITMADTDYDTELQGKEVDDCVTVQDLVELITSKESE